VLLYLIEPFRTTKKYFLAAIKRNKIRLLSVHNKRRLYDIQH
jgi:hypothetical protein